MLEKAKNNYRDINILCCLYSRESYGINFANTLSECGLTVLGTRHLSPWNRCFHRLANNYSMQIQAHHEV